MTERAFHHGNLRAVLLEEAVSVLREDGADGLSLRELARRAGVSHGAPRSHFADRQALLDALAADGFARLTGDVEGALAREGSLQQRFRGVAQAYVDFAVDDAALMELMFATTAGGRPAAVQESATRLFTTLDRALGPPSDHETRTTFKLLFAATMQGIASLVASRRIARDDGARLVDASVETLLESPLGRAAVPRE